MAWKPNRRTPWRNIYRQLLGTQKRILEQECQALAWCRGCLPHKDTMKHFPSGGNYLQSPLKSEKCIFSFPPIENIGSIKNFLNISWVSNIMPCLCGKENERKPFGSWMGKHFGERFALDMYEKNQTAELEKWAHACVESSRSNPTGAKQEQWWKDIWGKEQCGREFPGQENWRARLCRELLRKEMCKSPPLVVETNMMLAEPQLP